MLGARLRCQIELLKICCVQALFSCDELSRKKLKGCEKSCSALGWKPNKTSRQTSIVGVERAFYVWLTSHLRLYSVNPPKKYGQI